MRAARVKNVPFFYFLPFPPSFSDAMMFNLKNHCVMETKAVNFEGRELPSYLGSVRFDNDVITADYLLDCDGSVVNKVTWEPARCCLETFLHGEFAGLSNFPDLNKAISYDFQNRDLSNDRIYAFLAQKASGMGNIYVELPETTKGKGPVISYSPAGVLLSFRLPLPNVDGMFNRFLEIIRGNPEIQAYRYLDARLVIRDYDGRQTETKIPVAEFIVAVAYLTRAAGIFARSGVISHGREFRLMVTEAYHAGKTFSNTFTGHNRCQWFTYLYSPSQNYVAPGVITRDPDENQN
jgi:hypothetical protein